MADLTSRNELAETPADGDLVHIVDVSDTTDNAAGSSKKITRANLVGGLQAAPAEGAFVDGDKTKLDGIETNADVTDATNVNAAGAVMESDFNQAHSVLAQQAGTGTPGVVNLSDSQLLGKTSGGNIEGQSPTAVRATLNVEDGADVTDVANVTTALASITIDALSGVDTDKSKTPADGDVLTFDGTDWNAEAAAGGGGGGFTPAFIQGFNSAVDTTQTSGGSYFDSASGTGATMAFDLAGMHIASSGTTSTGYASLALSLRDSNGHNIWDGDVVGSFRMGPDINGSGVTEMVAIIGGLGTRTLATSKYIGFELVQDSGTTKTINAISCDGTTEQSTDISANWLWFTSTNVQHLFSFVFTAGTDVKFYVDGSLVATHSTNIPSGAPSSQNYFGEMWVKNNGSTANNQFGVSKMQAFISAV